MQDSDLFEVSRLLHALTQSDPLAFKYVNLKVLVEVVDEEAHVLP